MCVFFRNLAKIYRTAILMNFSWCLRTKSQMSVYVMAFLNPLMLVVTDGHKYLNKSRRLSWRFPEVCMTFITTRHERVKRCSNQMKSGVSHQVCSLKKLCWNFWENCLQQSAYWKLITMLKMSSAAVFLGISENTQNIHFKRKSSN